MVEPVAFRCGEALCKKPVPMPDGVAEPWPVRCQACQRYLFPQDLLEAGLDSDHRYPRRAELLWVENGTGVSCTSAELRRWAAARNKPPEPKAEQAPEQPSEAEINEFVASLLASGKTKAEVWQELVDAGVEPSSATTAVAQAQTPWAPVMAPAPLPIPPQVAPFPFRLSSVKNARIAEESFGWLPAIIAAALFCFAAERVLLDKTVHLAVLMVVAGIVLIGFDVYRRKNRVVLAGRDDGQVGVYCRGELSHTITYDRIARWELHPYNSFRYLLVPLVFALGSLVDMFNSGANNHLLDTPILGVIFGFSGLISLIRTRFLGDHLMIPTLSGGTEEVYLTGEAAATLFRR